LLHHQWKKKSPPSQITPRKLSERVASFAPRKKPAYFSRSNNMALVGILFREKTRAAALSCAPHHHWDFMLSLNWKHWQKDVPPGRGESQFSFRLNLWVIQVAQSDTSLFFTFCHSLMCSASFPRPCQISCHSS
jgi:hypothetical protein